jgi:hypothetical protein
MTEPRVCIRLSRLFGLATWKTPLTADPMPVIIVAAPLQGVKCMDNDTLVTAPQVWFKAGAPLLTALRTALALPGILRPTVLQPEELQQCLDWQALNWKVDSPIQFVDGSVIQRTPLPALSTFLRLHPEIAAPLTRLGPALSTWVLLG